MPVLTKRALVLSGIRLCSMDTQGQMGLAVDLSRSSCAPIWIHAAGLTRGPNGSILCGVETLPLARLVGLMVEGSHTDQPRFPQDVHLLTWVK